MGSLPSYVGMDRREQFRARDKECRGSGVGGLRGEAGERVRRESWGMVSDGTGSCTCNCGWG